MAIGGRVQPITVSLRKACAFDGFAPFALLPVFQEISVCFAEILMWTREQQPDEQADRTLDHDDPDMTVIDRSGGSGVRAAAESGRQRSTTRFDDRQRRRRTRDSRRRRSSPTT